MSTYIPSPAFEDAANYLSNSSSLFSVSNAIKLEIYGLYKYLTVSHTPNTSRPSVFDMTGRAKWDAWKSTRETYGERPNEAESRYIAIAQELGWKDQKIPESAKKNLDSDTISPSNSSRGAHRGDSGFGVSVSTMNTSEEQSGSAISELAVTGTAEKLQSFLDTHPESDINARDKNGYTPLHLACDRGNIDVVRLLLNRGADITIKDADDLSALELAEISGQEVIVDTLKAL